MTSDAISAIVAIMFLLAVVAIVAGLFWWAWGWLFTTPRPVTHRCDSRCMGDPNHHGQCCCEHAHLWDDPNHDGVGEGR